MMNRVKAKLHRQNEGQNRQPNRATTVQQTTWLYSCKTGRINKGKLLPLQISHLNTCHTFQNAH
jgi:hypothetical protein